MPQFLHDNNDAKAIAIPRVFSENSPAKNHQTSIKHVSPLFVIHLPVRIAQVDRALDLKARGCGFDFWAGQPNKY